MIRYKAVISYHGANYHGWQTQRKGNSIQEVVEQVLMTIQGQPCEVVASGRTDARVHAIGQVFHFDSPIDMSGDAYQKAMNALLPKDIRIQSVKVVDNTFHARFDARSKRYDYYVTQTRNDPFHVDLVAFEAKQLDVAKMQASAQVFIGTHDFTSFTSSKIDPRKSRTKTITRFDISQEGKIIHFILEGDGFLRYMVRMMVQTIIEVGKGKIDASEVKIMLDGKDKHLCRFKADAQGLYLVRVDY